jgi:hypothetical protein
MNSADPKLHNLKPDDPLRLIVAAALALTAGVAIIALSRCALMSHDVVREQV